MSKLITLTFSNNNIEATPYVGKPSQSVRIVQQADGNSGIRSFYTDLALNLSETGVWASPYEGSAYQSFWIIQQPDGSSIIRNAYSGSALTMTEFGVRSSSYVEGNRNQRFNLIPQADGSTGLRKVSRSLFNGTVDAFEAIKRVGNWFFNSVQQPTGFYHPKNSVLTCELLLTGTIEGSQPTLIIGAAYTDPDTTYALPRIYPLTVGLNTIRDEGGGMVYLLLGGEENTANLTFTSGVVEAPCFEHKKNTLKNYRDMLRAWDSSPFVELISERAVVTVSRAAALTYQSSDQNILMDTYEQIISIEDNLLGLDGSTALHKRAPLKHHLILGNYGGPGYAHAAHGYTAYHENFGRELLTPNGLKGSWGVAHELGHQNQMLAYLAPDFIEVTNNIHSLAVERAFGLPSTLTGQGADGRDIWDSTLAKLGSPNLSIADLGIYERLAALEQLRLAFGDQFWRDLNRTTREQWSSNGFWPNREKAFDNLGLFASIAAKADLRDFFSAWGIPLSNQCKEDIGRLGLPLPSVKPQTLREPRSTQPSTIAPPELIHCTDHPHPFGCNTDSTH
ncbi:hypothetical protein [Pseudomonas sp. 31 R 17]|uniref:M60 family metallopeptidase n=1 Tax=Pseudomonas sp. 31 R 17 TaxID=1844101 RepID=UPI000811D41E|nr:M60 family metallopeptidase [Pseudomonas sp. 31 R 17]CRM04364.1 hypothetical protein [Pseudomonas sp. 31 R 17]